MNDDDDDKHQRPVFGLHPAIDKLGESSFIMLYRDQQPTLFT